MTDYSYVRVSIERETKKGFLERFQQINVIRRTSKQSDHRVGLYASESLTEHTVDVQYRAERRLLPCSSMHYSLNPPALYRRDRHHRNTLREMQ